MPHLRQLALAAALAVGASSAARAEARYTIDPARSRISVHVRRAGALSSFLHDHDFLATRFGGDLALDENDPSRVSLRVTVAADSLREAPGSALSADDVRTVEEQVRGPRILDAARFPRIDFLATRFEPAERVAVGGGALQGDLVGTLTLHGVTRVVRVPVAATVTPAGVRARGGFDLRQSDFAIKPYKKAWGSIAIHDTVHVELAVQAVPR